MKRNWMIAGAVVFAFFILAQIIAYRERQEGEKNRRENERIRIEQEMKNKGK